MTGQTSLDELLDAVNDRSGDWLSLFLTAVRSVRPGATFTAAGLADEFGLPDPPNPKAAWGGAVMAAKNAGLCRKVGYVTSERATTNHSAVALWERVAA